MPRDLEEKDFGYKRMMRMFSSHKEFDVYAGVIGPRARKRKKPSKSGEKTRLNVAQVASVLEFGTRPGVKPKIPERPFLRSPFAKMGKKYNKIIDKNSSKSDNGLAGAIRGCFLAAEAFVGDVIKAINAAQYAPLAEATIRKRRKNDKLPLIDTGQLVNAIGTRIKNKSKYRRG